MDGSIIIHSKTGQIPTGSGKGGEKRLMKHPALARVFAVVLCIFAVLMLLNGTLILLETRRDHRDAVRAYDLLSSRVDEYETLNWMHCRNNTIKTKPPIRRHGLPILPPGAG